MAVSKVKEAEVVDRGFFKPPFHIFHPYPVVDRELSWMEWTPEQHREWRAFLIKYTYEE